MKTFEHPNIEGKEIPGYCKWLREFPSCIDKHGDPLRLCIVPKGWEVWDDAPKYYPETYAKGIKLQGIFCASAGSHKRCYERGEI